VDKRVKTHKMHVENRPCDCGDNECHGHTVHHLICVCGYHETFPMYDDREELVREHVPDWNLFREAMRDTKYPQEPTRSRVGNGRIANSSTEYMEQLL
jgi:hypothetical protein